MATIKIEGMRCGHCSSSVTKALNEIDGISDVVVDLEKKEASFTETGDVDMEAVKAAIDKIGFTVVD